MFSGKRKYFSKLFAHPTDCYLPFEQEVDTQTVLQNLLHPHQSKSLNKSLNVVISNAYLHFAVVAWQPLLISDAEWQAFALHHFREVYGKIAQEWQVILGDAQFNRPRLCCASPRDLYQSLVKASLTNDKDNASIKSVQPLFTAAHEACSSHFKNGSRYLFAVKEDHCITLGYFADGAWQNITVRHASTSPQGLLNQVLLQFGLNATPEQSFIYAVSETVDPSWSAFGFKEIRPVKSFKPLAPLNHAAEVIA